MGNLEKEIEELVARMPRKSRRHWRCTEWSFKADRDRKMVVSLPVVRWLEEEEVA